jgi:mRNA interferase RelE/StbE
MKFKVEFSVEAASDLDKLFYADKKLFKRVFNKIESLADNPREGKPLVGNHKGEFSLRLSSYRIVYEFDTTSHTIFILTIKHRKHVY